MTLDKKFRPSKKIAELPETSYPLIITYIQKSTGAVLDRIRVPEPRPFLLLPTYNKDRGVIITRITWPDGSFTDEEQGEEREETETVVAESPKPTWWDRFLSRITNLRS